MDEEFGRDLGPPTRWVRSEWDEPDLDGVPVEGLDGSRMTFLYELDRQGQVLRSIDLMGEGGVPVSASSLAEFWQAQGYKRQAATPQLVEYETRYGGAQQPRVPRAAPPRQPLSQARITVGGPAGARPWTQPDSRTARSAALHPPAMLVTQAKAVRCSSSCPDSRESLAPHPAARRSRRRGSRGRKGSWQRGVPGFGQDRAQGGWTNSGRGSW
jgi:hypothetical protein